MSFSGGFFIRVTPFDFTVGETKEDVGDNNKTLLFVREKVNNQESQINKRSPSSAIWRDGPLGQISN